VSFLPPDSSLSLPLANEEAPAPESSPLQAEVMQLFSEFRGPLLKYVASMGLPVHDGEEVLQEVFLALFKHLRLGKPRTHLKGWIYRVGHNLALKQRIRNGRRDRLQYPVGAAEAQLHPQLDPEAQLAEGQRRRRLLAEVEAMPEVDRCCLYLRSEGLRYREIAEVLGVSLGGVSLSLGRALARLREVDKGTR
jgi:RNA polymerase sigma-70 factor (ECF subfamily)